MRILEICPFSAGICGVWARVREESIRLSQRGYEMMVLSSNAVKGKDEIACPEEKIGEVNIKRFPFKKIGGESFMKWDFMKESLEFNPDVIIAHCYRHIHTTRALKIAEKLRKEGKNCKVILVTHAPFERKTTRTFAQNVIVWFYDNFIGRATINKFDKIVAISRWEIPYLLKIGAQEKRIAYVPNGIPEEFFSTNQTAKSENKMLFLGRISPIKNIETAIKAIPLLKNKKIYLEIVGPAEEDYLNKLKEIIKKISVGKRVVFSQPIYNLEDKIKKIDSAKIFILPSKTEGMPQGLIEAMARERIVIASDIPATRDLIKDGKTGLLFEVGNEKEFAKKIEIALKDKKMGKAAKKSVEIFRWDRIIEKIEKLIKS